MIGVFYSSQRGKSEFVTTLIKDRLKEKCDVYKVSDENLVEKVKGYNRLIFIIPTYGFGVPHQEWINVIEKLREIDFSGKDVGLIGRGNQGFYAATFVNGMKPIYDVLLEKNANIVGETSIEGYDFVKSTAVVNGKFIGLVLDEMFMLKEIKDRLNNWLIENFEEDLNEK